mmetsp:Transcript_7959/g.15192  ORF Transcript_7959/g.15192 Transcript_7959/m.15192 type:complete len:223 (+) Transcript_7959:1292-1960(+)
MEILVKSVESESSRDETEVAVLLAFKPNNRLKKNLFPNESKTMYSTQEARQVLWDYCTQEGLDSGRAVTIDPVLADALFTGKNFAGAVPDKTNKNVLVKRLEENLDAYFAIVKKGEEETARFRKGGVPKVNISLEQRQGRKQVTKVSGLEQWMISEATFCSLSQKKFASSCAVVPIEGKNNLNAVVIQGNVLLDIAGFVKANFNVPSQYIEVTKGNSKSRKK